MRQRVVRDELDQRPPTFDAANRSGRLPTVYRVTREDIAKAAGVEVASVWKAEQRGTLRVHLPRSRVVDLASVVDYSNRAKARKRSA